MTTNTGDRGRIVEHIEGQVERANERGLKLVGEAEYVNFSKYASPPIEPPRRGQRVRLGLDADGFVRTLEVLEGTAAAAPSTDRERTITRLAVLKAASNFLGLWGQTREDVRADHVLVLADKWLAWVEQD